MFAVFIFIVVVLAVVFAITAARRYMQGIAAAWNEAASALGLDFEQRRFGRPRISGTIDGLAVAVDVHTRRSGDSSKTFTRYRVRFPSIGFDFRLTRQTGLSRITQFFGAQDIEVGDPSFDEAFVVKTADETHVLALLDGGLRGVLVRAAAAYPGVVFEDHGVFYEKRGLESSRDVIVSTVGRLADAAGAISGQRSFARVAEIVATRERGDLQEAAAGLSGEDDARKTLDERLVELDTLASAGRLGDARRRASRLEAEIPADPELVGWNERLAASGNAGSSAESEPDALTFAEEVFAGNALSFESKRIFDEKYRGASIRWPASIKTVASMRERSDGSNGDAMKLIATVARIDHDLYGNTDIDVVVALPPETGEDLERGRRVTIAGTLTGVDPLVRNVFVSDADLE